MLHSSHSRGTCIVNIPRPMELKYDWMARALIISQSRSLSNHGTTLSLTAEQQKPLENTA